MRACLAYSVNDPAGSGIAKAILTLVEFEPTRLQLASEAYEIPRLNAVIAGFNEDVLYFEFLDEVCPADFYLVLSRHSSEAGVKSFTVHHPGNPMRTAVAGGKPLELPPS
ncbi:MAG: D-aminoacyl-tRNA deacylase, partial [Thermofilaceae archaeon]